MKITIYIKGKPKTIGTVTDGIFTKKVKESKHLFRKLDAWAIDYNAFHNSIKPNCSFIQVFDTENNRYYIISTKLFEQKGEVRRYNKNGEHLAQIFVSRRHWRQDGQTFSAEKVQEAKDQKDGKLRQGRLDIDLPRTYY